MGFSSGPQANPTSTVVIDTFSHTSLTLNYSGQGVDSFGGAALTFGSSVGNDVILNFEHPDQSNVLLDYDLGQGTEIKNTVDLNTLFPNGKMVFSINSPNVTEVGFEIRGTGGIDDIWRAKLTNVQATAQKYLIDLSQIEGIDMSHVAGVNFVLTGAGSKTLNIDWGVFTAGGDVPVVAGTITPSPFDQISLTSFPHRPTLGQIAFIGGGGIFVNWGLQTGKLFDLTSALNQTLTLALSATGTSKLKIEFISGEDVNPPDGRLDTDANGFLVNAKKVAVLVDGLTNALQNYSIPKALLDSAAVSGFDPAKIAGVVIVVDDQLAGSENAQGTIHLNILGLAFTPTADTTLLPVTDFGAESPSVGALEPCAVNNQSPCVGGTLNTIPSFSQSSRNDFQFNFNLANGSDGPGDFRRFGGGLILFGTARLFDATQKDIILGLKAAGTQRMKLEVEDLEGEKVTVLIEGLTGSFQNYVITKSLLDSAEVQGFDAGKIKAIILVVDDTTAEGSKTAQGNVQVKTAGLSFDDSGFTPIASINPDPTKTAADVTILDGIFNFTSFASAAPFGVGTVNVITHSGALFDVQFSVANANSFVGTFSSFDDPGTPAVETQDLSGFNQNNPFVIGVRGPQDGIVALEVKDANGHTRRVLLEKINGMEQFFAVDLSIMDDPANPNDVDLTQVKEIVLVVEARRQDIKIGTFEFRFGHQPVAILLDPTAGTDPDTIVTLPSFDSTYVLSGSSANTSVTSVSNGKIGRAHV